MSIFAFGDKVLPFSEKLVLYRREHKVEEVGETQSQDDEMRDEQSDTETAESVKETCKRQGCLVGIVRAPAKSVIDEIEVTLKEDSVAATTETDKKRQKKTVTFAEKIRVKEFEVDRNRTKEKKMRRNRRNRRAHDNDELDDDDESDDDEPLTIISCSLPLSKRHNLRCGCRLFLPLAC